jgi:hypothetical protein
MTHVCELRPHTDHDTCQVLEEATEVLAIIRDLPLTDPACRVHLIASLIGQAETALTNAVAAAHDDGYSPIEIAILLGLG